MMCSKGDDNEKNDNYYVICANGCKQINKSFKVLF